MASFSSWLRGWFVSAASTSSRATCASSSSTSMVTSIATLQPAPPQCRESASPLLPMHPDHRCEAAVDGQRRAGDVGGGRAHQEGDEAGDLLGPGEAAGRDLLLHPGP